MMMRSIVDVVCPPQLTGNDQHTSLRLSPRTFIAPLGDRAVVLDLARDKYLALTPPLAEAVRELISLENGGSGHKAARERLIADGILTEAPRSEWDQKAELPPEVPGRSLWPSDPGDTFGPRPISLTACAAVLWALTQAAWSLKHRTFQDTVEWISRQKARESARRRSPQQLLDEFFAARPWFPVKPICRLDALALCLHLRRNGWDAALVFGVKLEPFAAHCWVHADNAIINEPHELVRAYTPIMAV